MRENRTSGSEGGEGDTPFRPLPAVVASLAPGRGGIPARPIRACADSAAAVRMFARRTHVTVRFK
jgi:hypothetical protein